MNAFAFLLILVTLLAVTAGTNERGWVTIGSGCVGSRGNQFLRLIYNGAPGFVSAFRLIHNRNKIGCAPNHNTNWGCSSVLRTNMFVTDVHNVVMYPSPVLTKPQGGGWYHLPGYYENSPQLVFSDVGTRYIYRKQKMRVWYGEDLYDSSESDNHGQTCFTAQMYFVAYSE